MKQAAAISVSAEQPQGLSPAYVGIREPQPLQRPQQHQGLVQLHPSRLWAMTNPYGVPSQLRKIPRVKPHRLNSPILLKGL